MLDGVELEQVQKVDAEDQEVLAQHGVPGLEGDFLQDLGRRVTRLSLTGVITGADSADQLKTLREKFRSATPVAFVEDIAVATKVDKVLIEEFGVREVAGKLGINQEMLRRAVNVGFSGGEKKRNEILQMALFEPRLSVLDETDSGLDIDALKIVSDGVNRLRAPTRSAIVITHYQRLLNYIVPDHVHVLVDGRIVRSGGKELALELEEKGYSWLEGMTPEHAAQRTPQPVGA